MNAIMSCYFISQQYERDYVLFVNVENDVKHASMLSMLRTLAMNLIITWK